MEGKLFKMVEGYTLSLTGSIDDLYGISNKQLAEDHQLHKLSIKNCDAIANGYDLDEIRKLADEDFECELGDGPTTNESINSMIKKSNANGAEWGFKKALEILSDKKFSEKDMSKAWSEGYHRKVDELNGNGLRYFDKFIRTLQQTEWDVEVEMECVMGCQNLILNGENSVCCGDKKPKLDADGCLILRRI